MLDIMQLIIAFILVFTFMILSSKRLYSCVRAFGIQSFLLASAAGIIAYSTGRHEIYIVAFLTLVIKVIIIPYIFIYLIKELKVKKEVELYISISSSIIIGGLLVVISYYLISSISILSKFSIFALSVSVSLVVIGLFIMISRKKAITQVIGIMIMENGLFLGAISLTHGMPLIVELGIFFDLLIGVFTMGILIFRINKTFETIDTDRLKTLDGGAK